MMQMLADTPGFADADLTSLRYAIVGGAPMPVPLINQLARAGVFIRQGYGLTEVGPNCFSLHQDDADRQARARSASPTSTSRPAWWATDGADCGADEVGELWLRSEVVTPGYWRNPEATAEAITDGWFHTGDMVRRDDEGFYFVMDRKKNMYISGGENVYPAEVEAVLEPIRRSAKPPSSACRRPRGARWARPSCVLHRGPVPRPGEALREYCRREAREIQDPRHFRRHGVAPQRCGQDRPAAAPELA